MSFRPPMGTGSPFSAALGLVPTRHLLPLGQNFHPVALPSLV